MQDLTRRQVYAELADKQIKQIISTMMTLSTNAQTEPPSASVSDSDSDEGDYTSCNLLTFIEDDSDIKV